MNRFNDQDLADLEARGISVEEVEHQLSQYRNPPRYSDIVRPCTAGDGILRFEEGDIARLISAHDGAQAAGRVSRFVPASGAATRMFRDLFPYLAEEGPTGSTEPDDALQEFLDGLPRFAFYQELKEVLELDGLDLDDLAARREAPAILKALMTEEGMGYADLPKGLLLFHRCGQESRTAFEEHVIETVLVTRDDHRNCRMHFTVSAEHLTSFTSHFRDVGLKYMEKFDAVFDMACSMQKESTDVLAVDEQNRPFRLEGEQLLFRPGGHGALIENLADLEADIVFIKNIDNVQTDSARDEVVRWKKALGGFLVELQNDVFDLQTRLERLACGSGADDADLVLAETDRFLRERLNIVLPDNLLPEGRIERAKFFLSRLDRPVRVCGVVPNTGEPGGGPFWVQGRDGIVNLQIVETAQIDPESDQQQGYLASSTHFNPVDLVCGVRNRDGEPYELARYVDQNSGLITKKSSGGKPLKALERPGLWNGAMAGWNTVFVEVPLVTFSPVKTVNDLLRPEHQQEG
jgi:hypothetical protein